VIKRRHVPRHFQLAAATALFTAIAITLSFGFVNFGARPAFAITPYPLIVTPIDATPSELLKELSSRTTGIPEPNDPMLIRFQSWSLNIIDDGVSQESEIVPEITNVTRYRDGTRIIAVHAGQPVDAFGNAISSAANGEMVGELLWTQRDTPATAHYFFSLQTPSSPREYATFLRISDGYQPSYGAAEYISSIALLLSEQQLNGSQISAILEFLSQLPDIRAAGMVTDRLGRTGVAFSAAQSSNPEYLVYLIVNPDNGDILAIETVYKGTSRTDIASPSVTRYYAWERTP